MATKKPAAAKISKGHKKSQIKADVRRAKVAEGVIAGKKDAEIAAEIGVTRERVSRIKAEPDFQERIAARVEAAASLSDKEVIGTLANQMRADVTQILTQDGRFDLDHIRQSNVGHLIKKIKARRVWEGKGEESEPVDIIEVELHNAQTAAMKLAEILGLNKQPAENPHDERARIEAAIEQWMKDTGGSREKAIEYLSPFMPEVTKFVN